MAKFVKPVVTRKAAPKPIVAKNPLENKAEAVMKKLGLEHTGDGGFAPAEPITQEFSFFEEINDLPSTCAVYVIGDFLCEADFDGLDIVDDDLVELFKYAVARVLSDQNRKQLIATTKTSQEKAAKLLVAAGFKNAGTSVNPGSRNAITIWVLSI